MAPPEAANLLTALAALTFCWSPRPSTSAAGWAYSTSTVLRPMLQPLGREPGLWRRCLQL